MFRLTHRHWLVFPCVFLSSGVGCVAGERLSRVADGAEPNFVVGTQAIGGPYQFSEKPYLLEVACEIKLMGSNVIKFALNPKTYMKDPYHLEPCRGVRSMTDLLRKHPVFDELMAMDFDYFHIWAKPYCKVRWQDGVDTDEARALYDEFYEFTSYLLKKYKETDRQFYLGHWEGDWLLSGSFDPEVDPTPERIRGFAQYLDVRQRAVSDARKAFSSGRVRVYHYTEVNQVWKGINGRRPTLTNSVLPLVDVDFVSYSMYDVINRKNMRENLHRALDHIESRLKPRSDIAGKRVFVGEYAIKASAVGYDMAEHDRRNREVTRAILEWGCPFALYWEFYCNEPRGDSYEGFWLVDHRRQETDFYHTLKNYYAAVRSFVDERLRSTGRMPSPDVIREFAIQRF